MDKQHFDEMLDALTHESADRIPDPPPIFLKAVSQRRGQRRLAQTTVAVMFAAAFTFTLIYANRPVAMRSIQPRVAVSNPLDQPTAIVLTRLNSRLDAEHLILPAADSQGRPTAVNLSLRSDPAEVDRWFQQ